MEEWRAVTGYEGFYEVSNLGRVRRIAPQRKVDFPMFIKMRELRSQGLTFSKIAAQFNVTKHTVIVALRVGRKPNRILQPQPNCGYASVTLCKNGKQKQIRIHKLVMQAFAVRPSPAHEVNHKDGNKANPMLENLEYVTHSENALHSTHVLGNRPPKHPFPIGNRYWVNALKARKHVL